MRIRLFLLLVITLGAAILRLVGLTARPLGFTWDEAALGYNAYSLLQTGRDEFGAPFPVVFKSFGDYKPGLYIYFTVPAVGMFGLTESAVRVTSALLGVLSVVLIYMVVRLLYPGLPGAAVGSALTLAINPWAIHFSRGGWEANVSLFLTLVGVVLFLRRRFSFSALFFGLTLLTYQGAKMFTPLLILSLVVLLRRSVSIRSLAKMAAILFLVTLPVTTGFVSQSGRLKVFSVFSYTRPQARVDRVLSQEAASLSTVAPVVYHSEKLDQIRGVLQRFLNHFSSRFLFVEGDWSNLRHSTPYHGNFYYPEVLLLVAGLALAAVSGRKGWLLVAWAVFSVLPASLSRDIVTAVRSLPLVIPLSILIGLGWHQIFKLRVVGLAALAVMAVFVIYFLDLYFVHSPHFTASSWLYPYKPALQLVQQYEQDYQRIVFTDTMGQPYIFLLFYNRVDPRIFQKEVDFQADDQGDVGKVVRFGKYDFTHVDWPAMRGGTSTLFVGDQYELPEKDMNPVNLVRLGELKYPNGSHALRIVGLK